MVTLANLSMVTSVNLAYLIALVMGLGVAHAMEPDHIVTLRSARSFSTVWKFALSHGLGFLLIGLPLVALFGYLPFLDTLGDVVGIGICVIFLVAVLMDKEIEFGFKTGIIQGGLALTPTKFLVAILVSNLGLELGFTLLILFTIVSSLALLVVGLVLPLIPSKASKVADVVISMSAILYLLYTILK